MERRGKERGESKGKKKFERRKKNSRRLALSRDVALILCFLHYRELDTHNGATQRRFSPATYATHYLLSAFRQRTCVSQPLYNFPLDQGAWMNMRIHAHNRDGNRPR